MRSFKKIAAVILVAALALSLTSCLSLDEAKAHHLKYTDDTHETISFNGKTYKKLPDTLNSVCPAFIYGDGKYNLTDSDVPVLVSDVYGSDAFYNEEFDLISAWTSSEDTVEQTYRLRVFGSDSLMTVSEFFTTEEHYKEYAAEMEHPEYTTFATTLSEFDKETEVYGPERVLVLSDEAAALLEKLMKDEDLAAKDGEAERILNGSQYCNDIWPSTKDGLIVDQSRAVTVSYDYENGYFISFVDDGGETETVVLLSDEAEALLKPYLGDYDNGYYYYSEYYD